MNSALLVLVEVIKYAVPALIVFLTVYFIMNKYMDNQFKIEAIRNQDKNTDATLALRLGAYERLMMFCERIYLPNLLLRIRQSTMDASQVERALMIAVQQEYDHNLSQQIYTSGNLWKIVELAKNDTLNQIVSIGQTIPQGSSSEVYSQAMMKSLMNEETNTLAKAKEAIRTEVSLLL